jgi:hypothetical protein
VNQPLEALDGLDWPEGLDEPGTLVLEQHFAIVPEWIIDADISDAAYRLYSVLLRYGQSSGTRMPSRALLARRLRKRSTDSVDRALKELVLIGAIVVERRRRGRENLTNRYHLRSTSARVAGPSNQGGGRKDAATPERVEGGRKSAATPSRTNAARVAANLRPNPVVPTQTPPPPTPPPTTRQRRRDHDREVEEALLRHLKDVDLRQLVDDVRAARRKAGLPIGLWTRRSIDAVLHESIHEAGWPPEAAVPALMAVATDPATQSPARLPHPGPWWNVAEATRRAPTPAQVDELTELEARLAETDGSRVALQRQARDELRRSGEPITQHAVFRLACQLLDQRLQAPVHTA